MSEQAKRPRVACVCRILWNGGVQRTAIAQTEGLRSLGYTVDLVFLRRVKGTVFELPSGSEIYDSPGRRSILTLIQGLVTSWFARHRGPEATVDLDRLWAARVRLSQYDVVIYNDQYGALIGAWNRLTRGQPYIMMFHEFFPKVGSGPASWVLNPVADAIDALSVLVAPAIVTTSSSAHAKLARMAPGRTLLARLGAPKLTSPIPPQTRDRHSIFSITVWDRGRHPELYLEVAKRCPKFKITLAGIWADQSHLEELRTLGREVPNVQITGNVTESERVRLEAESLLYLRYGFDESGPGLGGLEALERGSIVICNAGLGLAEILVNGRNGFVLNEPDVAETCDLLVRIERMSMEELVAISESGRLTAAANSWEAHCQVLTRAIQGVVQDPGTESRLGNSADRTALGRMGGS